MTLFVLFEKVFSPLSRIGEIYQRSRILALKSPSPLCLQVCVC